MEQLSLFEDYDKNATKKRADQLLSSYHRLKNMAGREVYQRLTASISDEPMGAGIKKDLGDKVSFKVDCGRKAKAIEDTLRWMHPDQRLLLEDIYINNKYKLHSEYYFSKGLSERAFYYKKEEALLSFAEAYGKGELMVMKKSPE